MKKNIFNNKTNIKVAGLIILATMGTAMLTGCDTAPVIQDEVKLQLEEAEIDTPETEEKENAGDVGKINNNEKDQDNKEEEKEETTTEDEELKSYAQIAEESFHTLPENSQDSIIEYMARPVKKKIPGLITKQLTKSPEETTDIILEISDETDMEEVYALQNLDTLRLRIDKAMPDGHIEIIDLSRFPKLHTASIAYLPGLYDLAQLNPPSTLTSISLYGPDVQRLNGIERMKNLNSIAVIGHVYLDVYEGMENLNLLNLVGVFELTDEFKKAWSESTDALDTRLEYYGDPDYEFIKSLRGGRTLEVKSPEITNLDWLDDLPRWNTVEVMSKNLVNYEGAKRYEERTNGKVRARLSY